MISRSGTNSDLGQIPGLRKIDFGHKLPVGNFPQHNVFDILIGKMSGGLSSGNGYLLKAATATVPGQSLEILTTARVFGVVIPSSAAGSVSAVSAWVERDKD